MQAPDPVLLDVLKQLLVFVGAPAATALGFIWFLRKAVLPKTNGITQAAFDAFKKDLLYHIDIETTEHFDQLRRDLTTTIEKTLEDRLTAYLFRQELDRVTKKGGR